MFYLFEDVLYAFVLFSALFPVIPGFPELIVRTRDPSSPIDRPGG